METITISERIVIVGAGIAGLFTALKLAPRPVTVLTAGSLKSGGSSHWAQGGVAAAIADDDSPQLHLKDTIEAGAGLVDPEAAHVLCSEGPARLQDLVDLGVPFDRDRNGALILGREAAHSLDRIVHVKGDQAGQAIMSTLVEQASNAPHIEIKERIVAEDLATDENGCVAGVYCLDVLASDRFLIPASAVVLATGGIGGLFTVTTNPKSAVGSGLAMAALVGAVLRDLEFVQFHPTALDVGSDPAPLATEALRGDGAILVNADGRRFMADYHDAEEFAPRDIVARAVEAERAAGRGALLDTRTSIGASIEEKYPGVFAAAAAAGIDAKREPLPVAPAAHYHMGGIKTDRDGQTSVEGL
ncbi:MAG: FAD-dependent oxidoreductase, partial [Pseudomonadota bacterium]